MRARGHKHRYRNHGRRPGLLPTPTNPNPPSAAPIVAEVKLSQSVERTMVEFTSTPLLPIPFTGSTYGILELFNSIAQPEVLIEQTILDIRLKNLTDELSTLTDEVQREEKHFSAPPVGQGIQAWSAKISYSLFSGTQSELKTQPQPWPKTLPPVEQVRERKHDYQRDVPPQFLLPTTVAFGPYALWGVPHGEMQQVGVLPNHKEPIYPQPGYLFYPICG